MTIIHIALLIGASIACSGLYVLSRSEIVDERVYAAAEVAIVVLPHGPMWPPVRGPSGVIYPVFERQQLGGHAYEDGTTVSVLSIWWRDTRMNNAVEGMFILLLLSGVAFGFITNQWSWPRVEVGRRIALRRLGRYALGVGVRISPIAACCLFLYWPIVSFWGSLRMVSFEYFWNEYWIVDSTFNRVAIGISLFMCYLLGCLFVARRRLNVLIANGEFEGINDNPLGAACLGCGYRVRLDINRCPECGGELQTHRRVLFVWPRFLGTPTRTKRRRARIGIGLLIAALLFAPLIVGVARVVLGWL